MPCEPRPLTPPEPEARFLALIAAGRDGEAAELLHRRFGAALRRDLAELALSLGGADEADHLANWAICQATRKGGSFDPAKGRLGSWLGLVARNLAVSQLRKLRPSPGLDRRLEARTRGIQRQIENNDAFWRVWSRIHAPELRRVLAFDLLHHGQAPSQLACRELGLERDALYRRRCDARKLFRKLWIEEHGGPDESFYPTVR